MPKEKTMLDGKLWCVHVQGPDDVHAAPDFWTALAWAAELNACIARRAVQQNWAADDNYPHAQAVVTPWLASSADHAHLLAIELDQRAEHAARREALISVPSLASEAAR